MYTAAHLGVIRTRLKGDSERWAAISCLPAGLGLNKGAKPSKLALVVESHELPRHQPVLRKGGELVVELAMRNRWAEAAYDDDGGAGGAADDDERYVARAAGGGFISRAKRIPGGRANHGFA